MLSNLFSKILKAFRRKSALEEDVQIVDTDSDPIGYPLVTLNGPPVVIDRPLITLESPPVVIDTAGGTGESPPVTTDLVPIDKVDPCPWCQERFQPEQVANIQVCALCSSFHHREPCVEKYRKCGHDHHTEFLSYHAWTQREDKKKVLKKNLRIL